MVSLAFAATAGTLTAGLSVGAAAAVTVGGGLLAAYIDSNYVYPSLFGKKNPQPDSLEGFQISTTDPGAPRWEVYGSRAWVPCHYLWSLNIQDEISGGGGGGKGGAAQPFVHTVRADVGLAVADGPITEIDTLYADERPFWTKQFNRAVIEDYRWFIFAGTGPNAGTLGIVIQDIGQQDFASVFAADNLVRLGGVQPGSLNGVYRVVGLAPHQGSLPGSIVLQPLEGQVPTTGTAGSSFDPASMRRIDQGASGFDPDWILRGQTPDVFSLRLTGTPPTGAGQGIIPSAFHATVFGGGREWIVNGLYEINGWEPSLGIGVWRLTQVDATHQEIFSPGPGVIYTIGRLDFQRVSGTPLDPATTIAGTPARQLVISRQEQGGFVFYEDLQDWTTYLGTRNQSVDPTLAATEPDASAHRGIAHMSLGNWNLGPHGNIFPRITALVRSRRSETIAATIKRICGRTMPDALSDVEVLRERVMLGYSIPGGLTSGQALQPLLAYYGIGLQDRGGVMTFLDERDLPVVTVATRHLNARSPGAPNGARGFVAQRIDEADLPERTLLKYIDPAEGANESEGVGRTAPGSPDRGSRDTLDVDLKPLVAWPYDVKRRTRELNRRMRLETVRGQISLPPSYMDVLPGTILAFSSNNHEHEVLPAGASVSVFTRIRDIIPATVALDVRFANGQVATLFDNGAGAFVGLPSGITSVTNDIQYGDGRVWLACSEPLDEDYEPNLTYRYEKTWLMRANKASLSGYDFRVSCDVVTTTTDNPLPPLPSRLPGIGGPVVPGQTSYNVEVLDLPPLFPGQAQSVWIGLGIAPVPGAKWRGATIYRSPNGRDRWTAIGSAQQQTVIGSVPTNTLPNSLASNANVIDWSTEVTVDLPNGETLDTVTTEQIGYGQNWAVIGDEIIAFHEAEAGVGNAWILRGLIRAMRHTISAMDTHADGERFILMTGLGSLHGFQHEPIGGYAAANQTFHFRVVPAGASIESVETISPFIVGNSARPAPPILEDAMVSQEPGKHIEISWERRSYLQTTIFGPAPLHPGEIEQYEVIAFNAIDMLPLLATLSVDEAIEATRVRRWTVGDPSTGTPMVQRTVFYTDTEWSIEDEFLAGLTPIGLVVYQLGAAGRSERSGVVFFTPA